MARFKKKKKDIRGLCSSLACTYKNLKFDQWLSISENLNPSHIEQPDLI